MFVTALIWGLGVSVGASLGMMVFVVLFAGFKWLTETEAAKLMESVVMRNHELLKESNANQIEIVCQLSNIAQAIDISLSEIKCVRNENAEHNSGVADIQTAKEES